MAGAISVQTCALGEGVEQEWDALAERVDASPFLRPGWFIAFARAFGKGELRLACVREEGRMVAILPLVDDHGALLAPVNWHTPEYGAVYEDADSMTALADHLIRRGVRRLDLSFLHPDDPLASALRAAARGARVLERTVQSSPYVDLGGSWKEFREGIPAKRRSGIRRRHRRLAELGTVSFERFGGGELLGERLDEGIRVEALGWKGQRGTAIASQEETQRFYAEVAKWAAARGWLQLWFLRLDGRPLAFAYCLAQGGAQYVVKVGFDPEFRRFAPGTLLTREMLVAAFAAGLDRYEFLGQPEPYKLDWATGVRDLTRLQVFANTPAGLGSHSAWRYGRPAALRLLSTARELSAGQAGG